MTRVRVKGGRRADGGGEQGSEGEKEPRGKRPSLQSRLHQITYVCACV